METVTTTKKILERALAGSRWLVQHQNQDGSWTGLKEQGVGAFYKPSWAFSEVGLCAAAHRTLDYVYHHFFTAKGDFLLGRPHATLPLIGRFPYVNSYFIIGSLLAGHYEIGVPAVTFLLAQQARDHGGFYSNPTLHGTKNMSDTMSSSSAGIACLVAGKIGAARRVADYLGHMVRLQPWPHERFFNTIDEEGHLYTDITNDEDAYLRVIDTTKADQCWFAAGLPMAFLVLLERATNEERYRELAQWYFDFQQRCLNPWDGYSSGKAGWGCAMLYRITGDVLYRDIALQVAQGIMNRQRTDGSWVSGNIGKEEFTESDFDLTGEFALWLSLIAANVSAKDLSRIHVAPGKIRIPGPPRTQSRRETLRRTVAAHYRILKNEGLRKYLLYSYSYRKRQVFRWIKRKS
jgi:hypothetical protein